MVCEWSLRETTYCKRYEQTPFGVQQQKESMIAHLKYRSEIGGLYREILMFQAKNICYLSGNWTKRFLKDVIKWDGWEKLIATLEEMNTRLRSLDKHWSGLRQEEQWEWRSAHIESMQMSEARMLETKRIREAIEKAQRNKDRGLLLDWLRELGGKDVNPSLYFNENTSARAAVDDTDTGACTGSWILSHDSFETWKSAGNSFLWLQGKVGSGKSVLR